MKKGSRVSWVYAGKRTFGKVVSANAGTRAKIKTPRGEVTRVGSKDDPIVKIISDSTGNAVLKKRSELRAAPKKKK
jgi:hypothetical protein|tara:strand:- start:99 stop:326 length:228 start_codon:yes stop_codon:yes gene_type:complete